MADKVTSVEVVAALPLHQLIHDLRWSDPEVDLLEFVKDLDLAVADWEFSEALYKYFREQHKLYKAEVKKENEDGYAEIQANLKKYGG